jgi:3-deoxy-D-manno-octulosonic-acid transferase
MIESEIWPNIIQISYKKMIPLILLQGRMSEKSYKKWLFFTSLSKYLYKKFSLIVSQDEKNAKRYKKLGGKNILAGINLKNSIPAPYINNKEEKLLTSLLIKKQVILFASIHDNIEDEAAISSHISAKKHDINLITIIVPRHPKLLQNLISLTIKYKLKTKIRSQGQSIGKDTDIYIADTIGELGSFLKIANICFVGGSLSNKGGHNLAEPAFEKCAIIYGPDVSNHQKTSDILIKGNAAIQINNINELNNKITNLIKDKKKINVMAENAYKIINSIPSPNTVLLNKLKPFLKI